MTFNSWTTKMPMAKEGIVYLVTEVHTALPTGQVVSKVIKTELMEGGDVAAQVAIQKAIKELNNMTAEVEGGVPEDIIELIMDGDMDEALDTLSFNLDDALDDQRREDIRQIASEYAGDCGMDEDELSELLDESWAGWSNNVVDELMEKTNVKVAVILDLEWAYEAWHLAKDLRYADYEEIDNVLEFFGVSPHLVAERYDLESKDNWPTIADREQIVTSSSLFDSWDEVTNAGSFAVMWETDLKTASDTIKYWRAGGDLTLKKGGRIIIHDYLNGASALIVPTIKDATIPNGMVKRFINDGARKYGIQSCCHFSPSAWGSELTLTEIDPATLKTTARRVVNDDGYALLKEGSNGGEISYWSKATAYEHSALERNPRLWTHENGFIMRGKEQYPTALAARTAWG